MKKTITTIIILAGLALNVFAQTTVAEWFERADEYLNNGDYTNAVRAYSEAINRNIRNLDAYWFRGVAYFQISNYDACIADCDTVIRDAPDFSMVYIIRGDAYGAKGIYHKAVADYKKGLEKGYDPSGFNVVKTSNADMWFCGAMYMEIAVNRFLGNAAAVTRYENLLNAVCNRNGVTRAEVEAFYRNGIRALVSQVVDEEFNKISWLLGNKYNAVLTRNPPGQYILSYEGFFNGNRQTKTLSAETLDALLVKMRDDREHSADFNQNDRNELRAQAALIPAVALSDAALNEIKTILTNFYTNPSATTYNDVGHTVRLYVRESNRNVFAPIIDAYMITLASLNQGLASKVNSDTTFFRASTLSAEQQRRLAGLRDAQR